MFLLVMFSLPPVRTRSQFLEPMLKRRKKNEKPAMVAWLCNSHAGQAETSKFLRHFGKPS